MAAVMILQEGQGGRKEGCLKVERGEEEEKSRVRRKTKTEIQILSEGGIYQGGGGEEEEREKKKGQK